MKKLTLFLSAMLLACATNLWAESVTFTVTSTTTVSTSGTAPDGSSATFKNTYTTKEQLTGGNSMTLTLTGYAGCTITGITLSMKSNSSKGAGYLSVKAGTTTLASIGSSSSGLNFNNAAWHGAWSTSYVDVTPTMSNNSYVIQTGEDVVIVIGATANSLYCQSFTITYEPSSTPAATLSTIAISGTPTQLSYTEGEKFNPAGLTVTAKYSDDSSDDVTDNANLTWTITPEVLTARTTSVTVKATLNGVTSDPFVVENIVVTAPQPGDEVTVTFEAGVENASSENKTTITKKGITLTATTFDNSSYYQTYASGTFKASSTQGKITSIVFTCTVNGSDKYGPGNYSVPTNGEGTYTYEKNGPTGTWTGSATEVVLSASAQVRMTKVVVTYEQADPDAPDAPTISGESTFNGSTEVTITAGENLKIYYTTNGDEPTTASTLYTAPFPITATTTVKAIAVNETTSTVSDVAEKTFTHQDAVTLSAIDYTTDGKKVYLQAVTVVYANGAYSYLKDEAGVGLLYGGNFNFNAGDVVAGIAATTKVYNKLPELLPAVTLEDLTVTHGVAPSPAEAKAVPTAEEVNTYLLLKGVTLAEDAATTSSSKPQNVTVTFKGSTIDLRDQFGVVTDGTIKAGSYDVEGFVSVYNTTVQFYITKITSTATAIDNAAVEIPAVKTIENGQLIILRDGVKYNAMGVRLQ
ncbi:MAG: chitobiase/beta-hexosaminidase C-terminal domain-containing protein [Paludibacteraceae bacterium]|nr:chitobiase/beta-hexosaminidase C-terminal domain-containing protein [Paludibacteraceae bacterium]